MKKRKRTVKKALCVFAAAAVCTLAASCTQKQSAYDIPSVSTPSETETAVTVRRITKKTGQLLKHYEDLISTGEYTLKVTHNEVIGGESIPTVTTSVYHNGKIRITVEESYDSETLYFVEDGRLYFFTDNGDRLSVDFEPAALDISLIDNDLELLEFGETALYGIPYSFERYADAYGTVYDYLFSGDVLERKLVYKNTMNEYSVYTVNVTENGTDADALF